MGRRQESRSDEALVAACNRGDADAFEALYLRYRDWVVRLARRFTGNDEDALDVLQEVFAYFLGKFPGFRLTSRLTTFLYPAVKHVALAARRARGRTVGGEDLLAGLPASPAREVPGAPADLAAVVASLPRERREVLLMRVVDGMTTAEIAEALGVPSGTVKSRLHRALEALKADPRARRYFEP